MTQTPQFHSFITQPLDAQAKQQLSPQKQTAPEPVLSVPSEPDAAAPPPKNLPRRKITRIIAIIIILVLGVTLYFIWHTPTSPNSSPVISQQNFSGTSSNSSSSTGNSGDIHVYVVGAVKHPGVYTLPAGARVYQLLLAAGGPLPNANLVALNLATPLTDGEEVYVLANGEKPPTYVGGVPGPGTSGTATSGQLVNINTASADEMRLSLHISIATAQSIVNYRLQHGPYTSIDQLLVVVSKSIYDKIKGLITV